MGLPTPEHHQISGLQTANQREAESHKPSGSHLLVGNEPFSSCRWCSRLPNLSWEMEAFRLGWPRRNRLRECRFCFLLFSPGLALHAPGGSVWLPDKFKQPNHGASREPKLWCIFLDVRTYTTKSYTFSSGAESNREKEVA